MKKIIKNFCLRGLIFSSGGPLIYGIIILILDLCGVDTAINGIRTFKAITSTMIMAFLIAGSSIIWQIERIGIGYAILIHGTILYFCYLLTYLLNDWISYSLVDIMIFSIIFISGYLIIWLIIYLIEKRKSIRWNKQLTKLNKE